MNDDRAMHEDRAGMDVPAARHRLLLAGASMAGVAACSPTVRVEPPDKPIEINLNVRIEQEVRIRIDRDLEQLFDQNQDIF